MAETGTNVAVARRQPPAVIAYVEERRAAFASLLPADTPSDRFLQTFKMACNRQRDILGCTPASVMDAISKAAADGLMLDGREAALQIRAQKGKDASGNEVWVNVAVYVPMFQGLMKRARNSGEIAQWQAVAIVYEKEIAVDKDGAPAFPAHDGGLRFRLTRGDDESIFHDPLWHVPPGEPVGVYSIVRMKDGSRSREFMTMAQVHAIRDRARKVNPVWNSDPEEMTKKTVIRRHCKKLPMSSELARVFDNMDAGGAFEPQDAEIINEPSPADPEARPTKQRGGGAARLKAAEAAEVSDPPHDAETGEIDAQAGGEPWFE